MVYVRLGDKEKLQVIGIVDASYKSDKKSIGGMLIILAGDEMTKASPIMWKSM